MNIKSRLLKRAVTLLLCLILLFSLSSIGTHAKEIPLDSPMVETSVQEINYYSIVEVEPVIEPYWSTVSSVTSRLTVSNGYADIYILVNGYSNIDRIQITSKLQKQTLLFFWTTEDTYTSSSNSQRLTFSKNTYVGSGTYRIAVQIETFKNGVRQENIEIITNQNASRSISYSENYYCLQQKSSDTEKICIA